MGVARVQSGDYPSGSEDGIGELTSGGRRWRFQHVNVGNPQCAIAVDGVEALAALDLEAIGPGIERHELFPNRTNVSWFAVLAPDRIRARIFERGAGETASSGTGATGAAVAYVLDQRSPAEGQSAAHAPQSVTVVLDGGELKVGVGESLEVSLTGWAQPVFTGTMSDDFLEELDAVQ
jgi:diaminopimelate epimerase